MATVVSGGTCTYNGTAFNTLYKSRISSRPVLDEARRTVIYVEHTLDVEGYIIAQPTDPSMTAIRKSLMAVGGALTYKNKGFGDLVVNGTSPVRDACWGPIPELLDFVPLGGDCNAARVHWRCVTRIPECDFARYRFALLAYNYEQDWAIDGDGYTTIRMTGYLEIPMTRLGVNVRTIPDTADRYREAIRPEVPLGYQRTTQEFKLSKDKRRLDFSFVDTEIPRPLPDGCTKIEASHTVETSLHGEGLKVWTITLEATITLAAGLPKSLALAAFLLILASRVRGPYLAGIAAQRRLTLIPQSMRFQDDVFGRTSRFYIKMRNVNALTVQQILTQSGMWQPIEGTGFQRWRSSLQNTAFNVRGAAGAFASNFDDAIIDLCLGVPRLPGSAALRTWPGNNDDRGQGNRVISRPVSGHAGNLINVRFPSNPGGRDDGFGFINTIIEGLSPERSFIRYEPRLRLHETDKLIEHKPLPRQPAPDPDAGAGGDFDTSDASSTAQATGQPGSQSGYELYPTPKYQQGAAPTRRVIFSGLAERIGWRVPPPELRELDGVKLREVSRDIEEPTTGSIGDIRIFGLVWTIVYALEGPLPNGLPFLGNPVLGVDGGSGPSGSLTTT